MYRLIALFVVVFSVFAFAKMPIPSSGIVSFFTKSSLGLPQFACSGAKVTHPSLKRFDSSKLQDTYLLSAAHCLEKDDNGNLKGIMWASFDDGVSLIELNYVASGDADRNTDYSLWLPKKESKIYIEAPVYRLSDRKSVEVDELLYNWSFPAGVGLVALQGRVVQPVMKRPLSGPSHPWVGGIGLDLNITGGSSGSSIFDEKGEVVGIVVGTIANARAWKVTTAMPIWNLVQ